MGAGAENGPGLVVPLRRASRDSGDDSRPRRLELVPYVAGASTVNGNRDRANPFDDGLNLKRRVGADMKMGLGPNLTLEARTTQFWPGGGGFRRGQSLGLRDVFRGESARSSSKALNR